MGTDHDFLALHKYTWYFKLILEHILFSFIILLAMMHVFLREFAVFRTTQSSVI